MQETAEPWEGLVLLDPFIQCRLRFLGRQPPGICPVGRFPREGVVQCLIAFSVLVPSFLPGFLELCSPRFPSLRHSRAVWEPAFLAEPVLEER
jgi:hypothetical protein